MPNLEEMPDLDAAIARLDAAEAAETVPPTEAQVQADGDNTATPPEPVNGEGVDKTNSESTDTPAAVEPSKPAEPASKQTPPKPAAQSQFQKDKERRDTSWKALNAEKDKFKQEREQFEALKQSHQRELERFQVERAKANQKFTPDQFEQAARDQETSVGGLNEQAEAWFAQAEKLEASGDFQKAAQAKAKGESLKEEAIIAKARAKQYKDHAANMRANPDPTLEQVKQKNQHALREYTLAAVGKWPEFGKEGGDFQKKVAYELQEARKQGLEVNDMPVLLYHAARLVAAETTAARVSGVEKELEQLRAKNKELEALTAPGGGQGSVQRQPTGNAPKSDAEEEAELRSIALTL